MTQIKAYIIVEKLNIYPKLKYILDYCKICNSLETHNKKIHINSCNVDLQNLAIKIIPNLCYYKKYNECYKCIEHIICDIRIHKKIKLWTTVIYDPCECVYYIHIKLPKDLTCKKKIIDHKEIFFCTIPKKLIKEYNLHYD